MIYNAILLAAEEIKINKNHLNEVNYFPVPDNDTGENLAHLMQRIARDIRKKDNIKDMLNMVSDSSIKGSRGNSGAIFSQFFQGFEEKCPDKDSLYISELVACFESGSKYAYSALEKPVEGTILTAISSFAESLKSFDKMDTSLEDIFDNAFRNLQSTVEKTKYILKAKVDVQKEDAGALGFMYFVQGFIKGIKGKEASQTSGEYLDILDETALIKDSYHIVDDFKYCTEILLKNSIEIQKQELIHSLKKYGESIVITENKNFRRIHIHSNDPREVIDYLSHLGQILEVKADDMVLQQRLSKESDSEIGIVIDSIADLPLENLPDFVYMLPLNMIIDGVSYQDKRTVPKDLAGINNITSSQPNLDEINKFLYPIFKRHKHILVLTVLSKMSGLYERYTDFKKLNPDMSLEIIDTKLNSVAEGLLVCNTIQKLKAGLDFNQLIGYVESSIRRTKIFVSIKNLDGMVKSGRLNKKIGWALQKVGFLPLITIDQEGNGTIKRTAFTQKGNYKNLLKEIEENKDKIDSYALVHVNNIPKIHELEEHLSKSLGFPPLYISEISSIVENFSGEGSIAIGYQLKENYE